MHVKPLTKVSRLWQCGKLEIFLTEISITFLYFQNYSTSTLVPEIQMLSLQDKWRTDQIQKPVVLFFSSDIFVVTLRGLGATQSRSLSFWWISFSPLYPCRIEATSPAWGAQGRAGLAIDSNLQAQVSPVVLCFYLFL